MVLFRKYHKKQGKSIWITPKYSLYATDIDRNGVVELPVKTDGNKENEYQESDKFTLAWIATDE